MRPVHHFLKPKYKLVRCWVKKTVHLNTLLACLSWPQPDKEQALNHSVGVITPWRGPKEREEGRREVH